MGAPGSGKSTLARSLACRLGTRIVCLDEIRRQRGRKWGYSTARADRIFDESGAGALHRYESKFELFVLREVVAETAEGIIDCSGGVHLQYGEKYRVLLKETLAQVDSVVVAAPMDESPQPGGEALVRRLRERGDDPFVREWIDRGGRQLLSRLTAAAGTVTHADLHRVVAVDDRTVEALTGSLGRCRGGGCSAGADEGGDDE
ncbi:shikimate kinase [Nocardia nova]|uniref:shikimate kinase n=1 Tax=Nocardia nova TaxID=37330 RepID=UPI0033DCC5C6